MEDRGRQAVPDAGAGAHRIRRWRGPHRGDDRRPRPPRDAGGVAVYARPALEGAARAAACRRVPGRQEGACGEGEGLNVTAQPANSKARVLFASLIGTTIEFFDFYKIGRAHV